MTNLLAAMIETHAVDVAALTVASRDLNVCRRMQAGMRGTGALLNANRISRLELEVKFLLASIDSRDAEIDAVT